MPLLLFRYLMRELLKVFVISASVLVMVTAFGAAIKPLAGEDLIGPLQTAKYIMLAIVPMLQFAIPFAAGFAATLVLHRMTTDNEILAASVSGISYRRILTPMMASGVVLFVVMVILTQWVIPRFWALMDRHLAADVTRVIMTSIEKGMPFRVDRYQIYADRGWIVDHPGRETPMEEGLAVPDHRLYLEKVAAAELDHEGRIVTDVTARNAVVDVYRMDGRTLLMLALGDTVVFQRETGLLLAMDELPTRRPIPVPGVLRDDPMFMTQEELVKVWRTPDDFTYVVESKEFLADAMQQEAIRRQIAARLAVEGRVQLVRDASRFVVEADGIDEKGFTTGDGRPIVITEIANGVPQRIRTAAAVTFEPSIDADVSVPTFDLVVSDFEVRDLVAGGETNQRASFPIRNVAVVGAVAMRLVELPHQELLAIAEAEPPGKVTVRADGLRTRITDLRLEIVARLLRRYALSITAMLLPVLGAVLAMWLRDSLPLVIYVWAFAPSIADVLLISGGDHMIRQGQVATGVTVMWAGNGVLLVVLVYAITRMVRN